MDGTSEERLNLVNKIAKCKADVAYYKDQLAAADHSFRDLLRVREQLSKQEYERAFAQVKSALDDSNTNLNTENKAIKYYENKLANGDFSMETSKTVQKRKASDD